MSRLRENVLSNCENAFVTQCLSEGKRLDGRTVDEYRALTIDLGKAWGCCTVALGNTRVLAQVSIEVQTPEPWRPREGALSIYVELNAMAAPHFEPGRPSDLAVEITRFLEKCIKDSKAVDLESLCIRVKEKVWAMRLDINVLNHEGNIQDCASIAALTALAHFKRPDVSHDGEQFIVHNYAEKDPIPIVLHHYPVCVSYGIFQGGAYVAADLTLLEEQVADAQLVVGINAHRELCGLHLGGKVELDASTIMMVTAKAAQRAVAVVNQIKKTIEVDSEIRMRAQNDVSDGGREAASRCIGFQYTLFRDEHLMLHDDKDNLLFEPTWTMVQPKVRKKSPSLSPEPLSPPSLPPSPPSLPPSTPLPPPRRPPQINIVDKGSGVLIENAHVAEQPWDFSDDGEDNRDMDAQSYRESDDDVIIVNRSSENEIPLVEVMDSDSEEDTVVVLNADRCTQKRK